MKKYVYIIILFILVVAGNSCRSSRNIDRVLQHNTDTAIDYSATKESQSVVVETKRDSLGKVTNETRYLRTVFLDSLGRIRATQEEWRNIGSTELSVSEGRKTDVSITEEKTDSTAVISDQVHETVKEESKNDSRPVQGVEWLYIAIGLGIVSLIIFIILWLRKK